MTQELRLGRVADMSTTDTGKVGSGVVAPVAKLRMNWAFTLLEAVLWLWSILICVPYWLRDENYAYGWFVPVGMFLFLWMRLGSQTRDFWQQCLVLHCRLSLC